MTYKRMLRKALTALLRAIIIFFGFPLLIHLHKYTIPNLIRSGSPLGSILLITSVMTPMILTSAIDRQSSQTNEKRNT
jgi:hypothetical protein